MIVGELVPCPTGVEPFRRDRLVGVPATSGCYALTTALGLVLYLGLASGLRARMKQHLDTPAKVLPTPNGRAVLFHWIETTTLEAVERGWLNSHRTAEGVLPILNKADSPVSC